MKAVGPKGAEVRFGRCRHRVRRAQYFLCPSTGAAALYVGGKHGRIMAFESECHDGRGHARDMTSQRSEFVEMKHRPFAQTRTRYVFDQRAARRHVEHLTRLCRARPHFEHGLDRDPDADVAVPFAQVVVVGVRHRFPRTHDAGRDAPYHFGPSMPPKYQRCVNPDFSYRRVRRR